MESAGGPAGSYATGSHPSHTHTTTTPSGSFSGKGKEGSAKVEIDFIITCLLMLYTNRNIKQEAGMSNVQIKYSRMQEVIEKNKAT